MTVISDPLFKCYNKGKTAVQPYWTAVFPLHRILLYNIQKTLDKDKDLLLH